MTEATDAIIGVGVGLAVVGLGAHVLRKGLGDSDRRRIRKTPKQKLRQSVVSLRVAAQKARKDGDLQEARKFSKLADEIEEEL